MKALTVSLARVSDRERYQRANKWTTLTEVPPNRQVTEGHLALRHHRTGTQSKHYYTCILNINRVIYFLSYVWTRRLSYEPCVPALITLGLETNCTSSIFVYTLVIHLIVNCFTFAKASMAPTSGSVYQWKVVFSPH